MRDQTTIVQSWPKRRSLRTALLLCAALLPLPALGFSLEFPAPATALAERRADLTSYRLPTGPFGADGIPTQLTEGNLDQTAWRLDAEGRSTLELLKPLRDQITAAGWKPVFECETAACGGFDFRYGIDVLPEPEMHVDLGDFRFLAATRQGKRGAEYLSLLVSRSAEQGFVQLTLVGAESLPDLTASTKSPEPPEAVEADVAAALAAGSKGADPGGATLASVEPAMMPGTLGATLDAGLPFALEDLIFASGSVDLATGDYASLSELAAWLVANGGVDVALVGHSDSSGSLAANTTLSRKRAEAVRTELVARFGIDPARITAEGVGPLSPRASNGTEAGRLMNRRVEVLPTSTR